MSETKWKFTRSKYPSKTIRCNDCEARCQRYIDEGGSLPGPHTRYASVALTDGEERHKLCGACFMERKDAHDRKEAAR